MKDNIRNQPCTLVLLITRLRDSFICSDEDTVAKVIFQDDIQKNIYVFWWSSLKRWRQTTNMQSQIHFISSFMVLTSYTLA